MPLTSIIILTLNNLAITRKCLHSIYKYTKQPYEIIIIDNGSDKSMIKYLKKLQDIKLICNEENRGFSGGCNQGLKVAKGKQILLLNNDTVVSHNWLKNLSSALYSDKTVGMVGPVSNAALPQQLYHANYSNFIEYHRFASMHNIHNPNRWKSVAVLSGFCLLFKKEVLKKIGILDERFTLGTYEDIDFSYRAFRSGYKMIVAGDTYVHHDGNTSFKSNNINMKDISHINEKKFIKKWGIEKPEELLYINI
ncbi:glycosyltransferase family 2 protein [Evansella sp. AB-rgal1]|uniref:glycosyltransferase family 2 protein n=1 Tax=Evansella sp. AB-rgal1 TaxID=3242696 RepID=UPI00359E91FF